MMVIPNRIILIKKLSLVFGLLLSLSMSAQRNDSIPEPPKVEASPKVKVETPYPGFFVYDENGNPIPKKTVTYSLILPGMGQAYNKKWWKLPFVYGAMGGIIYAIDYNQGLYRQFRTALELELQGQPHEFTELGLSSTTLRSLRDNYDRYTQLSYMGVILVYGVIAIESFVDAHLQSFDVSDDLSLRVAPDFQWDPVMGAPTMGVRFVFNIE